MIRRVIAISLAALLLPGCAHNAEWMHRQPGVESTIGTDMNQAPTGRVIPPPGLGVDLSDRIPGRTHRDGFLGEADDHVSRA